MADPYRVQLYNPDPQFSAWSPKPKRSLQEVMAARNGTKGRLISQHKGPNTSPTPGAKYGNHKPEELAKAFNNTHNHAINQWQASKGIVGPTGQEDDWLYQGFNDPDKPSYELNQRFAYQHDMQATDAELQANTPKRQKAYENANRDSAIQGMWILMKGGTIEQAMAKTQQIFRDAGFEVRQNYSK